MLDLGVDIDSFNPKVLFTFEKRYTYENDSINIHEHDFLEIIYILSSGCTYFINDIPYKVKKGDILILNPHVSHGKIILTGTELVEFHAGFENFKIKNLPCNHLIPENYTPIVTITNTEADFFRCCNEILNEQSRHEAGSELILKALGIKLLVLLLRITNTQTVSREKGNLNLDSYDKITVVNTIIEFLNENYMKDLSLDVISQNMYLSPAYISKIFKEETGDSPINYLIKVRLSKAQESLKEGAASIKEVAQAVGYEDAYHFSKLYKKYYGQPPSKTKSGV